MCVSYWNLDTEITCPSCGKVSMWNLQTHFMGYLGSCEHHYKLGESVYELEGMTILLDGKIDDFNGDCEECGKFFDVGAEIIKSKVKRAWILKEVFQVAKVVKNIN